MQSGPKGKGGWGRCDGPPNETAGIVIVVVAFIASASLVAGRVRQPRVLSLLHHHRPRVLSSLPSGYIFWCFNFVFSFSSSLFWSALSVTFDCCSVRSSEVQFLAYLRNSIVLFLFEWLTRRKNGDDVDVGSLRNPDPWRYGYAPNLSSSSLLLCCCFFFALTDRSSGKPPFWNDLLGKDCCLGLLFFLLRQ